MLDTRSRPANGTLAVQTVEHNAPSVFHNADQFAHAQRVAQMLAQSELVPAHFRGKVANCCLALEMAHRLGASPLMVIQNLNLIHGRPSWSSQWVISCIESSGKFSQIEFQLEDLGEKTVAYEYWVGEKPNRVKKQAQVKIHDKSCRVVTKDRNGKTVVGPEVSVEMAVNEGWYTKDGSKWKTMPDLMLHYRAAAFFGRIHCPSLLMGMKTVEEVIDIGAEVVTDDAAPNLTGLQSAAGKRQPETPTDTEAWESVERSEAESGLAPAPAETEPSTEAPADEAQEDPNPEPPPDEPDGATPPPAKPEPPPTKAKGTAKQAELIPPKQDKAPAKQEGGLDAKTTLEIGKAIAGHEEIVEGFLINQGRIKKGQSLRHLDATYAEKILARPDKFLQHVVNWSAKGGK